MKRSAVLAALTAAGVTAATLAQVETEMPEDAPDQTEDETEDGTGDDSGEETGPTAVDPATAEAILDLPEAKGREAMARKLAFNPGMTIAAARDLLASAPRGGGLAAEMAGSRRLGPDGPAPKAAAARLDPRAVYGRRSQRAGGQKA